MSEFSTLVNEANADPLWGNVISIIVNAQCTRAQIVQRNIILHFEAHLRFLPQSSKSLPTAWQIANISIRQHDFSLVTPALPADDTQFCRPISSWHPLCIVFFLHKKKSLIFHRYHCILPNSHILMIFDMLPTFQPQSIGQLDADA